MSHPTRVHSTIHCFVWRTHFHVTLHETSFSPIVSLLDGRTHCVILLEALPHNSLPSVHPSCWLIARRPAPNRKTVWWTSHLFFDHFVDAFAHPHRRLCTLFIPLCGGALADPPNFTIMRWFTPLTHWAASLFKQARPSLSHLAHPLARLPIGKPACWFAHPLARPWVINSKHHIYSCVSHHTTISFNSPTCPSAPDSSWALQGGSFEGVCVNSFGRVIWGRSSGSFEGIYVNSFGQVIWGLLYKLVWVGHATKPM